MRAPVFILLLLAACAARKPDPTPAGSELVRWNHGAHGEARLADVGAPRAQEVELTVQVTGGEPPLRLALHLELGEVDATYTDGSSARRRIPHALTARTLDASPYHVSLTCGDGLSGPEARVPDVLWAMCTFTADTDDRALIPLAIYGDGRVEDMSGKRRVTARTP